MRLKQLNCLMIYIQKVKYTDAKLTGWDNKPKIYDGELNVLKISILMLVNKLYESEDQLNTKIYNIDEI